MDFIAIDVETANADQSSICQIGITRVIDGAIANSVASLVDPQAYFDPISISIHGIQSEDVDQAEKLHMMLPKLLDALRDRIVISHSAFDRVAITRAAEKHQLSIPHIYWLDSMRIARRAWPDLFGQSGYGLANIARTFGLKFSHHDAGEDARIVAEVVIRAIDQTGLSLTDWLQRVQQPISIQNKKDIPTANPEGPFFGETIIFTGSLAIPRAEAHLIAAALGYSIGKSVNKKITTLVVGDQDASKLAGHEISSKHRKAEELITKGQSIKILTETDFTKIQSLFSNAAD
nr:exonuclease domain-containing protein [uncultured Cohaesibacter sp.]